MASPGFKSDAAAMRQAIVGFEDASSNAHRTMAELENDLMSVLSRYTGKQATAFWQLHQRLQEDMKIASRELATMSNLVNESARNYDSGDTDAAQSLTVLSNQVGEGSSILSRLSGA